MIKKLLLEAAKVVVAVFLLGCLFLAMSMRSVPTGQGLLITTLPLGWLRFLQRNAPQLTMNWSMILTGLLVSVVVVVLGNSLLRGIFARIPTNSPVGAPARRWPWRWTICLLLGMWLVFLVAFGAAGVYRHTTWLMAYGEPWVQSSMQIDAELGAANAELKGIARKLNNDPNAIRKAIMNLESSDAQGRTFAERYDVVLYSRAGRVEVYLIIPRRWRSQRMSFFCTGGPDLSAQPHTLTYLPEEMAWLEEKYPAEAPAAK